MKNKFLKDVLPVSLITLLLCSVPIQQAQAKRLCIPQGEILVRLPAIWINPFTQFPTPSYITENRLGLSIKYELINSSSDESFYSSNSQQDLITLQKSELDSIRANYGASVNQPTLAKGNHSCLQ